MTDAFMLSFAGVSDAEGNQLASSLAEALEDVDPDITVKRHRERPDTQDFGATLAVILGSAAATAIAKGISTWLARNSGAKLEIRCNGELMLAASNLDSKDAAAIAKVFSLRK